MKNEGFMEGIEHWFHCQYINNKENDGKEIRYLFTMSFE